MARGYALLERHACISIFRLVVESDEAVRPGA